ncbi:MAG: hypothetical protein DWG79_01260 [Chloroflexi bacterium]|nr:hypothetical protein [Chloroflexota bacterium]MDA1147317.1 hypothetical protein [Chloroflexota bacterium]MQC82486.1 hypothetical protein [Chloroflexota bacterium]MQC83126.1 hypothetical protein [Chloroflexota bacterium]PKB56551.1 MAG: hypothetical protein BZY69_01185 [SAR202 cluster bacterium Casp-Chloro-G1]
MEWLLLLLVAAAAAAYVGWPRNEDVFIDATAADRLRMQRGALLGELAELDQDLALGRISAEDRRTGRRALAPDLRAVTEALQSLNEPLDLPAPAPTAAQTPAPTEAGS